MLPLPARERAGVRVAHRIGNLLQDHFSPDQRVIVPEAQDPVPALTQKRSPPLIRFRLCTMLTTIQFHDEHPVWATEVGDVPPDGVLPPELGPVHLAGSEAQSELALRISLVLAQPPWTFRQWASLHLRCSLILTPAPSP